MKCLIYCKEGKPLFVSDEEDMFGGEKLNKRIIGICELTDYEKLENGYIWKLEDFTAYKKSKSLISLVLFTLKKNIIDRIPKMWKYCYYHNKIHILLPLTPQECEIILRTRTLNYKCKNIPKKGKFINEEKSKERDI